MQRKNSVRQFGNQCLGYAKCAFNLADNNLNNLYCSQTPICAAYWLQTNYCLAATLTSDFYATSK